MRSCQACCRDFTGRYADCPFCGFNNATKGGPRSRRSLAEMERRRQEREEFERELAELNDEFAVLLRWHESAAQDHHEGILA